MKWRVLPSGALATFEIVEADLLFINEGVLKFCDRLKRDEGSKKKGPLPLLCVRAFNSSQWAEVRLEQP
jgi:hypothetical protein